MGDGEKAPLRVQFNPKVCLEFHGATITSDAGLLPIRELDEALGLTDTADGLPPGKPYRPQYPPPPDPTDPPVHLQPPGRLRRHQRCPTSCPRPGHASHRRLARLRPERCQHQRDGAL